MESLQNHYEREEAISRSIRNSITYPMIMTGMMTVVVIVLLVKVMPIFNQVFIQLGTEMTGFSRVLMNVGTTISRYSVVFVVILLLIAAFALYGTRTASGRNILRALGGKFRFTRTIRDELSTCRLQAAWRWRFEAG